MQDVEKVTHYGNDDDEQGWLPTYSLGFVEWWQSGHHPEKVIANFGHILDIKVGKKTEYSWLPTKTYHKDLPSCNFFSFKIWQIWVFFPWKILCIGQNRIFQV
jgi:hypothetical protein